MMDKRINFMHLCDVMRRETSKGADLLLGVWWVVYLCCTGSLLMVAKKMRDRRTTTHATHAHPPITTVETGV